MLHRALFVMWTAIGGAGCDAIFGRPFESGDDAPDPDARPDAFACSMPDVATAFVEGPPCAELGTPNVEPGAMGAAAMYIMGEQLHIVPEPNTQASNGCTVNEMAFGEGVFVQLAEVLTYVGATTYFQVFGTELTDIRAVSLVVRDGRVTLHGPAGPTEPGTTFEPGQWWRLRPDGQGVVAETSPDGASWTELGAIVGLPPQRVKVVFGATVEDTGSPAPGLVRVEHINVCP